MFLNPRCVMQAICAAAATLVWQSSAARQPSPDKTIRLNVDLPAGGTTDLMARAFVPTSA